MQSKELTRLPDYLQPEMNHTAIHAHAIRKLGVQAVLRVIGLTVMICGGIAFGGDLPPLVISSADVHTNTVVLPPNQSTNVAFHFKFKWQSAGEIKRITQQYQGREILISDSGAVVARGKMTGVLVDSNGAPAGLMLEFKTMAEARKAKRALTEQAK